MGRAANKLKEVRVRLTEGQSLYSAVPLTTPADAVDVMSRELAKYDREVICVVNLDNRLKPINFNIVSMGSVDRAITDMPNVMKSGILSNASSFMMLHNHPSGDIFPSEEDYQTTRRCIEAGKLMNFPCIDHIIVGGGNGSFLSIRETGLVDFSNDTITMTAEQILGTKTKTTEYSGDKAGKGTQDMAEEKTMAQPDEHTKKEEVTIKFGKGHAEPFTAKDGREFVRIRIPNIDPEDKSPWASFVLPARAVHENQYGKCLWAKIPAEGTTVVTKSIVVGQDDAGKNIWQDEKTQVPNTKLKAMVEAYKDRAPQAKEAQPKESAREKLDALAKSPAPKVLAAKSRNKVKQPEL